MRPLLGRVYELETINQNNIMHSILDSVYNLLCFITEDMVAHGFNHLPPELNKVLNDCANAISEYLDKDDQAQY